MKYWLTLTIVLTAAILMGADAATYIGHDKVADALAKGGSLTATKAYTVSGAHRTAPGQVEVHDKETDTFYVLDGSATIVTGGTMVGGNVTGPGQHRGTDITGGQAQRLAKGDVMVIPAGVPHWFKEVSNPFLYYVVKAR